MEHIRLLGKKLAQSGEYLVVGVGSGVSRVLEVPRGRSIQSL